MRRVAGPGRRKELIFTSYIACAATTVIALVNLGFPLANFGPFMFRALLMGAMYFAYRASFGLAAELAEDRQNQMLTLTFLTGARSADLFLSKLAARALAALYSSLALLPCLMVSILYGGITFQLCAVAFLLLPASVIFFSAFEFLGAAVKREPGGAEQFADRSKLVALAWPWAIDRLAQIITGAPMDKSIYLFTPAHTAWAIWEGLTLPWEFSEAIVSILINIALGLLVLGVSGWILDRSWQEETGWNGPRQLLTKANRAWAARIRPLLETAPMLWLAAFDRSALMYAWMSVWLILALWVAGFMAWRGDWLLPAIFYLTPALMIAVVRTQMILRAARRMAKHRREGELELLATTPLEPQTMVGDEIDAASLQFRTLIRTVRGLTLGFLFVLTAIHPWHGAAIWVHAMVSAFLIWCSFIRPTGSIAFYQWIGLNTGHGSGPVFRRLGGSAMGGIWPAYNMIRHGLNAMRTFPTGDTIEICIVALFGFAATVIAIHYNHDRRKYRTLAEKHFREIAQAPLPSAAMIKNWDGLKPLVEP